MSSFNSNAISGVPTATPTGGTAHPIDAPVRLKRDYGTGGLSPAAWIKIGVVASLMALLFRFNLSRLWLKTNPFSGQENWGHSFFIPLIGLYFLYVHREDLLKPRPMQRTPGSLTLAWGVLQLAAIAGSLLLWACLPRVLDWLEVAADAFGLFTQYHGWRIAPLYLLLPFTIATAIGALLLTRRPDLSRVMSTWAEKVWPALGAWSMAAAAAWGIGFFVFVISQALFSLVSVGLAVVSLASLVCLLAQWPRMLRSVPRAVEPAGAELALEGPSPGAVPVPYAGPSTPKERRVDVPVALVLADRLRAGSAAWFGGSLLVWGVLFSLWGIFPGQNDFFKDVGMVIALFGVALFLTGWGVMRVAWFPILFLFCGLPWPDQVYSWVAGPLQHLAAAVAVRFLTLCNIPSSVAGTKILMFVTADHKPRVLNVEEACAGLRSLMTFVTLAAGWSFVFMSSRPLWHRLVQSASAVPIAIFCNVLRVSGTGLFDRYVSHEWSEGFAHKFVGLVMLIPAFFLILLVGWVMDNLFVEVADEAEAPGVTDPGKAKQHPRSAGQAAKVVVPTRSERALAGGKAPSVRTPVKPAVAGARAATANKPGPARLPAPKLLGQTQAAPATRAPAIPAPSASTKSPPPAKQTPPLLPSASRRPAERTANQPARGTEGP